jgi:hypothetical protein
MSKEKYEKPFALDMPFGEALERLAQTDPHELSASKKNKTGRKKRKPSSRGPRPVTSALVIPPSD